MLNTYLYFSEDGTLKEQIQAPVRAGGTNTNAIFVYWEGVNNTVSTVTVDYKDGVSGRVFDNHYVPTVPPVDPNPNCIIPFDSKRDLKYFKYYTQYNFYVFNIPAELLAGDDHPIVFDFKFVYTGGELVLGLSSVWCQGQAVKADQLITIAQWNYLTSQLTQYITAAEVANLYVVKINPQSSGTWTHTGDANISGDVNIGDGTLGMDGSDLKVSVDGGEFKYKNSEVANEDYVDDNIYEMASASVVLSDSDYAYLLKNNVRIHYGGLFYEKAKETASQVIFYSVDYQRTTTGGSTGYTTRTTKKITLTKSSQQLDAADINDLSYNKEQTDKNFAHSLSLQLNTTNYKLSVYLYDKEGNALSTQTIDLPLESIVVSATYYNTYTYDGTTYTKVIVIVLATTDVPTIIPVGDLVDGLATTTQLTNGLALKVNKSDIADNLTTNDATKVLSAKQGYELNNAVVHLTSDETIGGNKKFTNAVLFGVSDAFITSDATFKYIIGYKSGNDLVNLLRYRLGYGTYFNGSILPMASNDIGSSVSYWRDLYLSGKWKDGTNEKSLQDLLDENASLQYQLNQLKEEFYETTIDIQSYEYQYLLTDTIPLLINSKNVVESIGMDCVNVKGNSYVYNQWRENSISATFYDLTITTLANYNIKISGTANATGVVAPIYFNKKSISGHKYLLVFIGSAYQNHEYRAYGYIGSNFSTSYGTFASQFILANCTTDNIRLACKVNELNEVYDDEILMQTFDLTQYGIDSVSTTDQAIAELMKLGINPYEYNEYNEGEIINSKPTKLVSKGFNLWDEETESGSLSTTGTETVDANRLRCKNYIPVLPNTAYYKKTPLSFARLCCYDKNKQFIQTAASGANTTFTTPANCYFIRFATPDAYGTTYNNDICINISNATLNGTYRPYIAPTEYALDIPILRSAGGSGNLVQDDSKKVNISDLALNTLTFTRQASSDGTFYYFVSGSIIERKGGSTSLLCNKYAAFVGSRNSMPDKAICSYNQSSSTALVIRDDSFSDETTFMNSLANGDVVYYEKATPTDQPTITLPENIVIQKGGTITAEYDSTDNAPSDFDFELGTSNIQ